MDELFDFLCRIGGPLSQFAHLLCNDRKALACIARPCRFHPGIERQKVGLERNFIDNPDDLADLARGMLDPFHGRDRVTHHLAGQVGSCTGISHGFARLVGAFGGCGDIGGDLLQRRGGFFERRSLLLGARGKIVGSGRDLVCAAIYRLDGVADARERIPKQGVE